MEPDPLLADRSMSDCLEQQDVGECQRYCPHVAVYRGLVRIEASVGQRPETKHSKVFAVQFDWEHGCGARATRLASGCDDDQLTIVVDGESSCGVRDAHSKVSEGGAGRS